MITASTEVPCVFIRT